MGAVTQEGEMNVRPARPAAAIGGAAGLAEELAAAHRLVVADDDVGQVVVAGLPAVGMVDTDKILAGDEGDAVGGGADILGIAGAGAEIERAAGPRAVALIAVGTAAHVPRLADVPRQTELGGAIALSGDAAGGGEEGADFGRNQAAGGAIEQMGEDRSPFHACVPVLAALASDEEKGLGAAVLGALGHAHRDRAVAPFVIFLEDR